jgi:polyhydroxybutyrate depolymerase
MPALRWANILSALVVAVTPAGAAASSAAQVAAPSGTGCRTGSPASGIRSLTFDGQPRSYLVRLPDDHDPRRPAPLALNLHGHNGSAERHEANSGFAARGARRGYIVVTPDSTPPNWNVREAPGRARDFAFIDALVSELDRTLCLDPQRRYVVGHSNGAAFAGLLACRPPYRFAAVAMVAGTPPLTCPANVSPATLFIRGTADKTVPYSGGVLGGALTAAAKYAEAYGCGPSPALEPRAPGVERRRYTGCRGGAEVALDTVDGAVHVWPGGPRAALRPDNSEAGRLYPAADVVLDFFDAH